MQNNKSVIINNSLQLLRQYTIARIALGRTGISVPVKEMLQFKMAHAHARDAVFSLLKKDALIDELNNLRLPFVLLQSKAVDRHIYLQRPDLGRRLNEASTEALKAFANDEYDICINIADGLSAEAINRHAIPVIKLLLEKLQKHQYRIAPICLLEGARVAISDETGSLLHSKLSLILIGERPGLSSADSMGAYLTYQPKVGLTDERRNCVSNIRPEGLQYQEAAEKLYYLIIQSLRLQFSGVALKDNYEKSLE